MTALSDDTRQPTQFTLRSLLVLQAVCAAFFGLLAAIGIWAVVVALFATLVYAAIAVPPAQQPIKRLVIDVMGGLVLPALCIYYDPGILRSDGAPVIRVDLARNCSPMIALQMAAFLLWLVLGPWLPRLGGLFAGMLTVGSAFAAVLGIIMLPASVIGAIVAKGIGLLGLTPLVTAVVFGRNAVAANRLAREADLPWRRTLLFCLGVALAVAIPLLLYWTLGLRWEQFLHRLPRGELPIKL